MTPQAHRRYVPPREPEPESPTRLIFSAVVLVITCAAIYSLLVGLG